MKLYKHMQPIEVAIVSYLASLLRERGFHQFLADDGGEHHDLINGGNLDTLLEVVNSVEDSSIVFHGPHGELCGVRFILGNGADIISDWATGPLFGDYVDTAIAAFGESRDLYRWSFWARWPNDNGTCEGLPEVYSKRVDEHGDLKVGEVTIKLWLEEDQTVGELAQWVEAFLEDLNYHPARDGQPA